MPLTRPFAIDQAYANASDFRKQHAAVFPREGVLPDPVTIAAAGIAFPNGGWNVGARIFTAVARRGTAAYSQAYGSALISNDSQATAWIIPAAPSTGSRIDLLWVKAADPTQGDATTTPSGETVPRAVPVFGVTSGNAATTPTANALPAGAVEIARITTPSTATSIANSVFSHTYAFANVSGGPIYFRLESTLRSTTTGVAAGETGFALDTGSTFRFTGTAWVQVGSSSTGSALVGGVRRATTNSLATLLIQFGFTRATGPGTKEISMPDITFPLPFAAGTIPSVTPVDIGYRAAGGAFNEVGLLGYRGSSYSAMLVTNTKFQANGIDSLGTYNGANDYYVAWTAVGVAP